MGRGLNRRAATTSQAQEKRERTEEEAEARTERESLWRAMGLHVVHPGTERYPRRVAVENAGEITELAVRVTDHELPTGAPSTVVEFSPDNPPLPNGATITFSTVSITE